MERDMLFREVNSLKTNFEIDYFFKRPKTLPPFKQRQQAGIRKYISPTFEGHPVEGDYKSGMVTEDIDIKDGVNGKSLTNDSRNRILYFIKDTKVTVLESKDFWIKVTGQAYYKENGKNLPYEPTSNDLPLITEGWIDRIYTDMSLGKFDNIDIIDTSKYIKINIFKNVKKKETVRFSNVFLPKSKVNRIVMHQTETPSVEKTMEGYENKIKLGSNIGSHYLIPRPTKGENITNIYLTAGIDQVMSHSSGNNSNSIGIEHVGESYKMKNFPTNYNHKDEKQKAEVRNQINSLVLSPQFKISLLDKTDSALWVAINGSWGKNSNEKAVHLDITPHQKRLSFLLTKNLRKWFNIGLENVVAHEKIAPKALGEGENITEFHQTMEEYPKKIKILKDLIDDALPKSNQTTFTSTFNLSLKMVGQLIRIKMTEEEIFKAINLDATHSENANLKKGESSAIYREKLRVQFYDSFYLRMQQIDDLINALQHPNSNVIKVSLSNAITNWQF